MTRCNESFKRVLDVEGSEFEYYPVSQVPGTDRLPYALTVLVENALRCVEGESAALDCVQRIVDAGLAGVPGEEIEFSPSRVLFQDFTGVPVFVDFAVMREACAQIGGDPARINPQIPCDLVIDHSVIADEAGSTSAIDRNMELEFQRNAERYRFLKWAQDSFRNVRIVPPGSGICHQLNIEKFAQIAMVRDAEGNVRDASDVCGCDATSRPVAYFDTLVGTDSHTPTANGIGVLGWGVGGIEAEAAALGQPITTLVPRVVGVRLTGELSGSVSAMDVALRFAQMLRSRGVVGCFVECFGSGLDSLSATQRACISNMTPEYGSTCTLFPVDGRTLDFLRMTGRSDRQVALVEAYAKAQGLWHDAGAERVYSEVIELDLSQVSASMSGPSRPHDRFDLSDAKERFEALRLERGLSSDERSVVTIDGVRHELAHGAVAIAAITSCTTAADPRMMLAAGLAARNAERAGLKPQPWVKCVFAPGSHAGTEILDRAGLLGSLRSVGFFNCGYGCMSCIGNSGPIKPEMHEVCDRIELASVLSGNRNFEGRISPDVSQNYLMQPAAVIVYAIAGTVDFDFESEPLGVDLKGNSVFARDLMPSAEELDELMERFVTAQAYSEGAVGMFEGTRAWRSLDVSPSSVFSWDGESTYVRRPPYFDGMGADPAPSEAPCCARVLAKLGDFITTDHISPAGSIAAGSPAALYLESHGVKSADFNTLGARRGNHEVMMRGTFANVKLMNELAAGRKGGWSLDFSDGRVKPLFDVSESYRSNCVPSIVVAGKMYGSGSSRDWAAKGPMLLGVRAVIAESFERIHRSNLVGMGVLPLQFVEGQNAETLGLTGEESYTVAPVDFSNGLPEPRVVSVSARRDDGCEVLFDAIVRVDTPTEGRYMQHGGILQYVLRSLASK